MQLLTDIATDVTVAAIPVNYTFVNDSRSPLSDNILRVIPNVPDYNPNRPINATSELTHINVRSKYTDIN